MDQENLEQLVPLEEVQRIVLAACAPLDPIAVDPDSAFGLVLAEDVRAAEDLPPFANTAMDGYAVRSEDTAGAPVELSVIGVLAAGAAPERAVEPGTAIQIMTGAPVPPGADAIIIVERTEAGSSPDMVRILEPVSAGAYVRPAGSDLHRGDLALAGGITIGPADVGLLVSVDAAQFAVHPRPRVGVLSTGDELVGPGTPLELGQIRDSNRQGLLASLQRDGFAGVNLGARRDDEEAIAGALRDGVGTCDALLTSGGVSMGEYDYVKIALEKLVGETGGADPPLQSRDQTGEAAVVRRRDDARGAGRADFRLAGQPCLVDGQLPGGRPAGAEEARRPSLATPPPPPGARRRGLRPPAGRKAASFTGGRRDGSGRSDRRPLSGWPGIAPARGHGSCQRLGPGPRRCRRGRRRRAADSAHRVARVRRSGMSEARERLTT